MSEQLAQLEKVGGNEGNTEITFIKSVSTTGSASYTLAGYKKYFIIVGGIGSVSVSGGTDLTDLGTYGPSASNGSTLRLFTATGGTVSVSSSSTTRNFIILGLGKPI